MTVEDSMNPLNHTQARNYLQAAADSRLKASERLALDEHLAACADCRGYAEQIGLLEKNIRKLFHAHWDAASERSINLLPGIRTRYRRKAVGHQLLSLVNLLVTVGVVVALLLLLNWFLSNRQVDLPAGNLTPTPTTSLPTPASPTPIVSAAPTALIVKTQPQTINPAGSLAFVSSKEELGDLYIIKADGTGQARLFEDNLSLNLSPAWSPDGSQLAFVSTRDGNSEIYTVNADGTQPTRLTDNTANETDPAWSPDGKRIAFVSDRSGYREVFVMDLNGATITQLTHTQADNTHPSWSPDGSFIAIASNRDGYWQIYRMSADGSKPTNLSNNPMSDDREPAWSPDGRRIAYTSQQVGSQFQEIEVMNADGSNRSRLTGRLSPSDETTSDFSPAWSPDSQGIAFCSYRDNPVYGDIYLIPAESTAVNTESFIRLTTEGASQPAWKP
jgi:Tol biopolymer transport system component